LFSQGSLNQQGTASSRSGSRNGDTGPTGIQDSFLNKAIYWRCKDSAKTRSEDKHSTNSNTRSNYFDSNFKDIQTLALTWGISIQDIRTRVVIEMYYQGQDHIVEDMVVTNNNDPLSQLDFVKGAMPIICCRLELILGGLRKVRELRNMFGSLDADTTMYVKEIGRTAAKKREGELRGYGWTESGGEGEGGAPNLQSTNKLILNVLRYVQKIRELEDHKNKQQDDEAFENSLGDKAHSLSILSSTLIEAIKKAAAQKSGVGGKGR
jgi:hypothetical protein